MGMNALFDCKITALAHSAFGFVHSTICAAANKSDNEILLPNFDLTGVRKWGRFLGVRRFYDRPVSL